jgi:hypothetical protein
MKKKKLTKMKRTLLVEKKPTKLLSMSKVTRQDFFLQAKHEKKIKKKKKMNMKVKKKMNMRKILVA